MTREEAKEILSRPFNMKNVPQDILEAHRMAIQALEQIELKSSYNSIKTELNDDAISRQGEKNISKGFEDFMIKSLRKQAESEDEK